MSAFDPKRTFGLTEILPAGLTLNLRIGTIRVGSFGRQRLHPPAVRASLGKRLAVPPSGRFSIQASDTGAKFELRHYQLDS